MPKVLVISAKGWSAVTTLGYQKLKTNNAESVRRGAVLTLSGFKPMRGYIYSRVEANPWADISERLRR